MFNNEMLEKLQQMKQQADESKERLSKIEITEDAGNGLIKITMNANRELKSVEVNADLTTIEKDDLEDLLVVALTRTLKQVNDINEQEVLTSAQSFFK